MTNRTGDLLRTSAGFLSIIQSVDFHDLRGERPRRFRLIAKRKGHEEPPVQPRFEHLKTAWHQERKVGVPSILSIVRNTGAV